MKKILSLLLSLAILLGGTTGTAFAVQPEGTSLNWGRTTELTEQDSRGVNTPPALAQGVPGNVSVSTPADSVYTIDLDTVFIDLDGDALTYWVSVNGGTAVPANVKYTCPMNFVGTVTLVFTANDGKADSLPYTVTLTVTETEKPTNSEQNWQKVMTAVRAYLTAQAESVPPAVSSTRGEWQVLGLARSGVSADSNIFAEYYDNVLKYVVDRIDPVTGRLHASKSTDNARVILALTAIGRDVTNVGGYDLLKGLSNSDYVKKQGVNGPIWALIALDSGKFEIPADADSTKQVTREWLVEYILSKQLPGGGWALSGTEPDDMTPMAVQALVPYYDSNEAVRTAVDKAISAMEGMVDDSFDAGNAETLAQIIVALSTMGIDAGADSRFSGNGVSVVEALLRYSLETGAFQHGMGAGANQMATEQGFYALVAYERFKNGQTSLYDMSDLRAEKFTVTIGEMQYGSVTVDKSVAACGETVIVTVSARTGYKLRSLQVNGVLLTVNGGKAAFRMPAADVTITAVFTKLGTVIEQGGVVENGNAMVEISATALKEAAGAVDAVNDVITIHPTGIERAKRIEVKLPAETVAEIVGETGASLVIRGSAAVVEIPDEILETVTENVSAGSVLSLIVERQDASHLAGKTTEQLDLDGAVIVEITLTVDGEAKTEFGRERLTIFLPLTDNFHTGMSYDVVVFSDSRAAETDRLECREVDGVPGVEFRVNHLSTFVVLDSAFAELWDAMMTLEVHDASKAVYDKIRMIEAAYSVLTNSQQDALEDAYDIFCDKVDDFEEHLDEAIDEARDALDDWYDALDRDDYTRDNWGLIKDYRKGGREKLKQAAYQEQVDQILADLLEAINKVPRGDQIKVTFRLIGDFRHDDGVNDHEGYVTWIETTELQVKVGSTMYDLFTQAMDEFDLDSRGASDNYVESIQAPDILGGYWLGEFDNGANSGWMYTVNGVHPDVGLRYYELKAGDEVVWHYVDDYKLEERDPSSDYYFRWREAQDISPEDYVDELAKKILTVGDHGKVDPAALDSDDIGRKVTFRFEPAEGYKVENVIVDGKSMGSIEKYTYYDLSLDSRIEVTFAKKDAVKVSCDDVSAADWFYEDVRFVVERGLFHGTDDDSFSPGATMTRAMLVTVLYRLEGEPAVYGSSSFADVRGGQWYTDAVIWAVGNGIVSGYDNGLFGTNDNVTREQMAAILYRYASCKGYNVAVANSLSRYADANEIHSYALAAMKWANAVGLINGRTDSLLVPGGTATRAEVAAIFHRFVKNSVS